MSKNLKTIFCSLCTTYIPENDLYNHVEALHVGYRSLASSYDLLCGVCGFQSFERKGIHMVDHIFRTGHETSSINLEWTWSKEMEAKRVKNIINHAIELLRDDRNRDTKESEFIRTTPVPLQSSPITLKDGVTETWKTPRNLGRKKNSQNQPEDNYCSASISRYQLDDLPPWSLSETTRGGASSISARGGKQFFDSEDDIEEASAAAPAFSEDEDIKTISFGISSQRYETPNSARPGKSRNRFSEGAKSKSPSSVSVDQRCHLCSSKAGFDRNWKMIRHAIAHSNLKLYECAHCPTRYKSRRCIADHAASRKRSEGCDGTFVTVATPEDMARIRRLLGEAFPEFDWSKRVRNGSVYQGLQF